MNRNFRPLKLIKIIFFVIVFLTAFSTIVMLLWNNILAGVLHVSMITFWQALGIFVLAKILFGGFHGGPWGRHRWKQHMHERWANMSPEEREKFKQKLKDRCRDGFKDGDRFKGSDHFEEQSEPIK